MWHHSMRVGSLCLARNRARVEGWVLVEGDGFYILNCTIHITYMFDIDTALNVIFCGP